MTMPVPNPKRPKTVEVTTFKMILLKLSLRFPGFSRAYRAGDVGAGGAPAGAAQAGGVSRRQIPEYIRAS